MARPDDDRTLPANRLHNLRRRVNRARRFPTNTCSASRHLHLIAEGLLGKGGYPMLRDDPAHCATTMLAVLESLWQLRTAAAELAGALRELRGVCLRMDAERDADRPSEAEYQGAMDRAAGALRRDIHGEPAPVVVCSHHGQALDNGGKIDDQ